MDFGSHLEHFSLRWNNFNDNMKSGFHDLLRTEDFVDVTIAAEGKIIQAHKMVLSVCSPYFKSIFKTNPCQHPVIFLKDVTHRELSGILQFMYLGEVSIQQEELGRFLKTAEALQIKGLTGGNRNTDNDASDKIESISEFHKENHKHSFASKTKPFNHDSAADELCSKKIKLNPDNDLVQSESSSIVQESVNSVLINNHVEVNEDDDDDDDNDHCSIPNKDLFTKTETAEVEISDVESDRISLKEESGSISDSFTGDLNFKESDNHSPVSGFTQDFLSEVQELTNECHSVSDNNQGLEYFPLLTKKQGRCPICGRILQHKKNLQTHIADQHSGIFRSWPCQICQKVCKTWSALRVHTNRHHTKIARPSKGAYAVPSLN